MDPRTTPARADIAAAHLKGQVTAARFVEGTQHRIARGRVSLRAKPSHDAAQDNELLFGEIFTVYEMANGWAWGQAKSDLYVGYLHTLACADPLPEPDHRVSALMTALLPAPDVKRSHLDMLPMNASVKVLSREKGYARIAPDGFVYERHLARIGEPVRDWVGVAERFLGAPYIWGGKTAAGLDCSGLVQTALDTAAICAPRDTDMQERSLGQPIAMDLANLRRGDLVFWKGHMGVMLDATRLLHANAFHMEVAVESLADAVARIAPVAGAIISIKRFQ